MRALHMGRDFFFFGLVYVRLRIKETTNSRKRKIKYYFHPKLFGLVRKTQLFRKTSLIVLSLLKKVRNFLNYP